jgi:hypothetical protein
MADLRWGINAYSRPVVAWYIQPTHFSGEIMTDMPYPIYPQQLYNAIKRYAVTRPLYTPLGPDDTPHLS